MSTIGTKDVKLIEVYVDDAFTFEWLQFTNFSHYQIVFHDIHRRLTCLFTLS